MQTQEVSVSTGRAWAAGPVRGWGDPQRGGGGLPAGPRSDLMTGSRFGEVKGYDGAWLSAQGSVQIWVVTR